jgi:hypothetical protein
MAHATNEYRLSVRAAGKTYSLDYRQAFRFGYTLLRTRKFHDAAGVFESMTHADATGRLAKTMLACCKAGLRDYLASSALLHEVSGGDDAAAERMHTAFVYTSVGMWADAAGELSQAAREQQDAPEICLLLGDVFLRQRKPVKTLACWRAAIGRDREGAVAAVARELIGRQTKPRSG